MKKIHIFSLSYLIVGVVVLFLMNWILPKDLFGRYQTIEIMREMNDNYDHSQTFIATVEASDRYLDFFINESGELCIITVDVSDTLFGKRYQSNHSSSTLFETRINNCKEHFNQQGTLYYYEINTMLGDYATVRWSVLPADCRYEDANLLTYTFSYDNCEYVLYVECA